MVEIVPFQEEHLDLLHPRAGDDIDGMHGISAYADVHAVTAIEDGEILGFGGVVIVKRNLAHAFMVLSDSAIEKPVRFCLLVKRQLRKMIDENQIKEVHVFIDNNYNISRCAWAIRMGFTEYHGQQIDGWTTLTMKV